MNVNQWFINFFSSGIENENMSDRQLAEELLKQIIRKSKKRKIHSFFIENILGADLTDMQLISKYAQVSPSKDKKCIIITDAFQKDLKESNQKPNKVWIDKGSDFQNRSVKS